MTLPPLYLEGLMQRARLGQERLNAYKLGLVEAILKDGLGGEKGRNPVALHSTVQTALEVARWEMPPPSRPDSAPLP